MHTTNADSPPRIGVCFSTVESLSDFAIGSRSVVGCQLPAASCQLSPGCRHVSAFCSRG